MPLSAYLFIISLFMLCLVAYAVIKYGSQLKRLRISLKDGSVDVQFRKPVRYGRELIEAPELQDAQGSALGRLVFTGTATGPTNEAPASNEGLESGTSIDTSVDAAEDESVNVTELWRRAQLEVAINDAAEWGWHMARARAFQSFPHPIVEWDADGNPTIVAGSPNAARFERVQQAAVSMVGVSKLSVGAPVKPAVSMESASTLSVGQTREPGVDMDGSNSLNVGELPD